MARLSDEKLADLERAIEAYIRIAALGEPDPDALDGLASIYERQANHELGHAFFPAEALQLRHSLLFTLDLDGFVRKGELATGIT